MKAKLMFFALFAAAQALAAPNAQEDSPDAQVLTSSFLFYHPDIKYRLEALEAYDNGEPGKAFELFKQSAHWADKASQAMVAEMLWKGDGVAADHARAYAWMDLAAERGYSAFVAKRERFWRELDEREQKEAIKVGKPIYADYGDEVAKHRLETRLNQGRFKVTGSHAGFVGALKIMVPSNGTWVSIDGSTYFADKYWKPDNYFEWQDKVWRSPPSGTVDVLPVTPAETADTPN